MTNYTLKKNSAILVLTVLMAASPLAVSAGQVSSPDDTLLQYYKENDKFSCTPEELADFLATRRKALDVAPNIVSADVFVESEVARKNKENPDNCLTLFSDLSIVEDIQKLVRSLQKLKMPDFSTDGMGALAQALATQLYDTAMQSICNALTKEAAAKLIDEVMNRQLGYDIKDIKEFNPKEFAKEVAIDHTHEYLKSEGIDPDWLDNDNHAELMKDELREHKDKLVDQMFN